MIRERIPWKEKERERERKYVPLYEIYRGVDTRDTRSLSSFKRFKKFIWLRRGVANLFRWLMSRESRKKNGDLFFSRAAVSISVGGISARFN